MDNNLLSDFVSGVDFETTRLHEENKLLKQHITQLENKLRTLNVIFEQETGREVTL
jgi:hypothetical protein|tara:strand:+ start:245 stop:412 length:168 start_codon:yes stop_codon:yes gene_type:complete